MMRLLLFITMLAGLGWAGWYTWENFPVVRSYVENHIPCGKFQTLEIRYSAEEIMQAHKGEFLKNQEYSFLEPKLLFYPYLLMDVKYVEERGATGEGILLWGLNDGEIVIHTGSWEKTHGFEDCLVAKADKHDFKILEALVEQGGSVDREKLYSRFKVEQDVVDHWLDSCRTKKLVAISGNKFRLHLQNPKMQIEPITQFDQPMVTQPAKYTQRIKGKYTPSEVKKMAQIAFGTDFGIRRTQKVYLPVYAIGVKNPDGSTRTAFFNALNGHRLDPTAKR